MSGIFKKLEQIHDEINSESHESRRSTGLGLVSMSFALVYLVDWVKEMMEKEEEERRGRKPRI